MRLDTRNWLQRWWDRAGRRWLNPWSDAARLRGWLAACQRLRNAEAREAARLQRELAEQREANQRYLDAAGGGRDE